MDLEKLMKDIEVRLCVTESGCVEFRFSDEPDDIFNFAGIGHLMPVRLVHNMMNVMNKLPPRSKTGCSCETCIEKWPNEG